MKVVWRPKVRACLMCGEDREARVLFRLSQGVPEWEQVVQGAWVCPSGHTGLVYSDECLTTGHVADLVEAERWTVDDLIRERNN